MTRAQSAIRIDSVGLVFGTRSGAVEALRDVHLTIEKGEFIALVGPSGCGKSTLMRAIAGLRSATSGRVLVEGKEVAGPLRDVGMVFQSPALLRWRTTLNNVLLPAELASLQPSAFRQRALELLEFTGLAEFADKRPTELSGGMQQRVSLCRALLLDPPLLLMDEPFGALDALTRDEMNLELLSVWGETTERDKRKTIIFVTHSIEEAVLLADRVVVMSPRPGRVAEIFDVNVPRPRSIASRADSRFGQLSLEIYETLVGQIKASRSRVERSLDTVN